MLSLLFFTYCLILISPSTGHDEVKPFETHSISVYVPGAMTNGNTAQRGVHYKRGVQDDSAAAKGGELSVAVVLDNALPSSACRSLAERVPPHTLRYFEDSLLSRGWGVLEIYTNDTHSPDDQAFAAGFLEGYITGHHIINNFRNLRDYF
ncbi:phospholipase B domain containing, partial [Perkinsus olseni]